MAKSAPCKGCTERFTACSDKCPKDARGEYGYKAWKAEYYQQKNAEKEYNKRRYEDWKRSEEADAGAEQFARYKNKKSRGYFYGR